MFSENDRSIIHIMKKGQPFLRKMKEMASDFVSGIFEFSCGDSLGMGQAQGKMYIEQV